MYLIPILIISTPIVGAYFFFQCIKVLKKIIINKEEDTYTDAILGSFAFAFIIVSFLRPILHAGV